MTGGYRAEPHEGPRSCPTTVTLGDGHVDGCSMQCAGVQGHPGSHTCACVLARPWMPAFVAEGLAPDGLKRPGVTCPASSPESRAHAPGCSTRCTGPVGHEGAHRCGCALPWGDGVGLEVLLPGPARRKCSSHAPEDLKHTGICCSGRCDRGAGHVSPHVCGCGRTWSAPELPADEGVELPADDAPEAPPGDDPAEAMRAGAWRSSGPGEVAQVCALLSISEELRTANLIAAIAAGVLTGPATKRAGDLVRHRLGNP